MVTELSGMTEDGVLRCDKPGYSEVCPAIEIKLFELKVVLQSCQLRSGHVPREQIGGAKDVTAEDKIRFTSETVSAEVVLYRSKAEERRRSIANGDK
jgi:hypothetical protein